jgi:hypothetical protein
VSFVASQNSGPALEFEFDPLADRWICSQGLRGLFGVPIGMDPTVEHMSARVVPEDRPLVRERFQHHVSHSGPFSLEMRVVDPQDRVRRLVLVGTSEAAAGGEVKRMSGFMVDITETVREGAAQAVLASAEHRATIEQAKGALMLGFGISGDAAFDLLRTYSNRQNIKLVTLADYLTSRLGAPEFGREDPVRSLLDILLDLENDSPDPAR